MPSADPSPPNETEGAEKTLLPAVVILGPTAVGKTEISIQLAERFSGEIISADSQLFYRGMDIGTAKPSPEDRARVPHHLIDVADPDEPWSLGVFQKQACQVTREIHERKHLPFFVGGTGQFIRSITEGWRPPPVEPNPRMRTILTEWGRSIGPLALHAKLAKLDQGAASTIDPSNVRRTVRALEVIFTTGKLFSSQRFQGELQYKPLLLGLTCPRPELYQRIDQRIAKMIEAGLVEEVQRLLMRGYSPRLPTLSAIGYGEIVEYLEGKTTLDEAIMLMKRRTRLFVRRQANWFRENDRRINWFEINPGVADRMGETIEGWLTSINWGNTPPQLQQNQ